MPFRIRHPREAAAEQGFVFTQFYPVLRAAKPN